MANVAPENAATLRQRVLSELQAVEPLGVWVPTSHLCKPNIGGSEGMRRLRELRAAGWAIEGRRRNVPGADGRRTNEWEYRIKQGT